MARPRKYHVDLTDEEVKKLRSMIRKGAISRSQRRRCQILLDMDEAHGKILTHKQSARANGVCEGTVAKVVLKYANGGVDEAIEHINRYTTHHSEAIITDDASNAEKFLNGVDSACVYHNASTRFTDGFEFGFGAEIGISTQKLHARGPMALKELTTYKWVIRGDYNSRK